MDTGRPQGTLIERVQELEGEGKTPEEIAVLVRRPVQLVEKLIERNAARQERSEQRRR